MAGCRERYPLTCFSFLRRIHREYLQQRHSRHGEELLVRRFYARPHVPRRRYVSSRRRLLHRRSFLVPHTLRERGDNQQCLRRRELREQDGFRRHLDD